MYKVFAFLTKRDGLSMDEFKNYYEQRHVPFVLSFASPPLVYKRRYLNRGEKLTESGTPVDFDVMTELVFANDAARDNWMRLVTDPEIGPQIAADEAKFLDRSKTRAYVVDEQITAG